MNKVSYSIRIGNIVHSFYLI